MAFNSLPLEIYSGTGIYITQNLLYKTTMNNKQKELNIGDS